MSENNEVFTADVSADVTADATADAVHVEEGGNKVMKNTAYSGKLGIRTPLIDRIIEFERESPPTTPKRANIQNKPTIVSTNGKQSVLMKTPTQQLNKSLIDSRSIEKANIRSTPQQHQQELPMYQLRVNSEIDALIQYKSSLHLQSQLVDKV